MPAGERTERPTPRRLREERREGNVPVSRDLVAALSFCAAAAVLAWSAPSAASAAGDELRDAIDRTLRHEEITVAILGSLFERSIETLLAIVLPIAGAGLVVGSLAAGLQTGGLVAMSTVAPKWERLDPLAGLRRLATPRSLMELVKVLVKLCAVAYAALAAFAEHAPALIRATSAGAEGAFGVAITALRSATLRAGATLVLLAVGDLALQRWLLLRELRMTKDDVRRDVKEDEGDPLIRSARRRLHRELVAGPMLAAVRSASVVVVNPTHLATALAYEPHDDAPRLVAKGAGRVARRIRREAERAGIPIVQNAPLARTLFRVELDDEVPEALYAAVVEVFVTIQESTVPTARKHSND
jgi:flagellar biosynthesis protein FlhB